MSIQEVPQVRRAARMEAPTLDLHLVDAVNVAVDAFREIEGERLLNNMLTQMLADSNARLERRGIRGNVGGGAEVESLHAQLKRARETNENGSKEYQRLRTAANELSGIMAQIAVTTDELPIRGTAEDAVKAWEAATS